MDAPGPGDSTGATRDQGHPGPDAFEGPAGDPATQNLYGPAGIAGNPGVQGAQGKDPPVEKYQIVHQGLVEEQRVSGLVEP